jgi:small subunit ribosomal protein S3
MKERIFIKKAKEQVAMKEFIRNYFANARCGDIEIQYTPLGTRIIIYTISPGLVIGSGGEKIKELTEKLKTSYGVENPQIDVQKIREPDLDANVVAQSIASALEKNINYKKLGNFHLEKIMDAGAIGVEIIIGGKLSGEKSRRERFVAGYIKKAGQPAERDVVAGRAIANPPLGNICVNVRIMLTHEDKRIRFDNEPAGA